MTIEELKAFFSERPTLTNKGISREAGLSINFLGQILRGEKKLTSDTSNKLLPILKKYGYKLKSILF